MTRWRLPRFGLRARAAIAFGATGLVVAVTLAAMTYSLTRRYLVEQREDTARVQAYVNARLARSVLRSQTPDVRSLLASLGGGTASTAVVRYREEWFSATLSQGREAIPSELLQVVADRGAGTQRYRDRAGNLHLAVGVAVPAVDAAYFELFALAELERTLELLARSLAFGVATAAAVAAAVGRAAAGRVVRPLKPVVDAAERIAGGDLSTRVNEPTDPDLHRLADAFNTMAAALQARIEREARFAADVSHEMRSPLAALSAALEIVERRREQLPPQVAEAFTVMAVKVRSFQQMVLELLEISRMDAGSVALAPDLIDLRDFLSRLLARHGAGDATIEFAPDAPLRISADRRRLAQAIGNILENAARYAGGITGVCVAAPDAKTVRVALDDSGPGVPAEEREAIFGRFARGEVGTRVDSVGGTGLGLALVSEHLHLHNGRAWVEDAPGGGARFVIELPVEP